MWVVFPPPPLDHRGCPPLYTLTLTPNLNPVHSPYILISSPLPSLSIEDKRQKTKLPPSTSTFYARRGLGKGLGAKLNMFQFVIYTLRKVFIIDLTAKKGTFNARNHACFATRLQSQSEKKTGGGRKSWTTSLIPGARLIFKEPSRTLKTLKCWPKCLKIPQNLQKNAQNFYSAELSPTKLVFF